MSSSIRMRAYLLGLIALVLGTAAAFGVSEQGSGPDLSVTIAEASESGSVFSPVANLEPSRLKSPEEMTAEERELWDRVAVLRSEGQGGSSSLLRRNNWWGDQMPYGCDQPWVQALGSQYYVMIDDGNLFRPGWGSLHVDFWSCFLEAYNEDDPIQEITYPWHMKDPFVYPYFEADSGSIMLPLDEDYSFQWGVFRGENLLGYCIGNVYQCGHNPYYFWDSSHTCEESIVVTLWDMRDPPGYLAFGYEIFDDIPWDEYDTCGDP